MISIKYLEKWKALLNITEIARKTSGEGQINVQALHARVRNGGPEFTIPQSEQIYEILKDNIPHGRNRVDGPLLKNLKVVKVKSICSYHDDLKLSSYDKVTVEDNHKYLKEKELKAFKEVLVEMYHDIKNFVVEKEDHS